MISMGAIALSCDDTCAFRALTSVVVELETMLGWANKERSDIVEHCQSLPCSALPEWEGSEGMLFKHSCRPMIRPRRSLPALSDPGRGDMYCERRLFIFVMKRSIVGDPTDLEQLGQCQCIVSTPWRLVCSIWKGRLPVCSTSLVYAVGRGLCSRNGKTGEVPMSFCNELGSGYLPVLNVNHYHGIVQKQTLSGSLIGKCFTPSRTALSSKMLIDILDSSRDHVPFMDKSTSFTWAPQPKLDTSENMERLGGGGCNNTP
jgi:hypothetical protein